MKSHFRPQIFQQQNNIIKIIKLKKKYNVFYIKQKLQSNYSNQPMLTPFIQSTAY